MDQRDAGVSVQDGQHAPGVEVEGGRGRDRHQINPRADQLLYMETLRTVWLWGLGWGVGWGKVLLPSLARLSPVLKIGYCSGSRVSDTWAQSPVTSGEVINSLQASVFSL